MIKPKLITTRTQIVKKTSKHGLKLAKILLEVTVLHDNFLQLYKREIGL